MYRVSFNNTYDRLLQQINNGKYHIDRLTDDISSGRKIHKLSDDPVALNDSLSIKRSLSSIEQFKKNIGFAKDWLAETETVLTQMNNGLTRGRELAVQMANVTETAETREAAAEEVDQIIRHLVAMGNTTLNNRYILSGQLTSTAPYTITESGGLVTAVTYHGDGNHFSIPTNFDSNTEVNIAGSDIPGSDVFNSLINLRTALSNNQPDQVRTQIGNLDTALQEVNTQIGKIGSRMNSLEAKEGALESVGIDKQTLLSDTVDTDIASAITDLNKYQTAFEASLKLLSTVKDLNIMNYI